MNAFRFRLAKILDWYENEARREEERLRSIAAALEVINQKIFAIRDGRQRTESALISAVSITPYDLTALVSFQARSRKIEYDLEAERAKCQTSLEEQRNAVQTACRRVRLMEKLRERRRTEYCYWADRELEQLAADAFQSARFSRQSDGQ